MKKNSQISVIIAGGSGFWAEQNHFPAIIQMKKLDIPVKVVAIIDKKNISTTEKRPNLEKIIQSDNPVWISPFNKSQKELTEELKLYLKKQPCQAIIISTNPVHHFFYLKWAIDNGINVICDKPFVVEKNSSHILENALLTQKNFEKIEQLYKKEKIKNNKFILSTPLRRRALAPFLDIAKNLNTVYKKTGEGISYMNVINNGGLHRYPIEFLKGGAHGYLDGVGSLAHSSYHYIDIIAWYLQLAQGEIEKIKVSLPYVFRVRDYLKTKKFKKLKELIEENPSSIRDQINLPKAVLLSELDFTFNLELLNKKSHPIGLVSYTSNHTSYTPRLTSYNPKTIDHAHELKGGRMSHLYIDIHQGALQNWQLMKNDVVFHGNEISTIGRQHPKLGKILKKKVYSEAYDKNTISPKDLIVSFIKYSGGLKISKKHFDLLSNFEGQRLTNRLFSKFYEGIALEYEVDVLNRKKRKFNNIIKIKDFI
jgi:hypothetical protein